MIPASEPIGPAPGPAPTPDPILTASLYCAGRLDDVVRHVVAPFADDLAALDAGGWYLWSMRYRRCGEHLKLRLHGPEDLREPARRRLARRADAFFATVGQPAPGATGNGRRTPPPIDEEDRGDREHPDGTLLWTHYVRSHVALGGPPLLHDDGYATLLTRALAGAFGRVRAAIGGEDGPPLAYTRRLMALLDGVVIALAALGGARQRATTYLAYHRDWLVRFALLKGGETTAKGAAILSHFRHRAAAADPLVARLRHHLEDSLHGGPKTACEEPWGRSVSELATYTAALCRRLELDPDPFAAEPVFAAIFKATHGLANQLGLNLLEEAFAHHLLLAATGASPALVAEVGQLTA